MTLYPPYKSHKEAWLEALADTVRHYNIPEEHLILGPTMKRGIIIEAKGYLCTRLFTNHNFTYGELARKLKYKSSSNIRHLINRFLKLHGQPEP